MGSQLPNKHLRIGVFKGQDPVTEAVIKNHQPVSFGRASGNTLVVPSSVVPDSIVLFNYNEECAEYALTVPKGTKGKIILAEGKTIDLENASNSIDVKIEAGQITVPLTESAKGKVVFGRISVLFQFVSVKDATRPAGPALFSLTDVISLGLLIPIIFSAILHFGFLTYLLVQDWPRDDESIGNVMRYIRQAEAEVQIDTEDKQDKEEDPVIEEPNAEPSEFVQATPEPDMGGGDDSASKSDLMERITDAHREQGAAITAQILGIDGGDAGDYFGSMLGSSAAIADMNDVSAGDIGIGGTGGLLNSLAGTTGGGSGNGLLGLNDGGGSSGPRVVVGNGAAPKVERKKIEFKVTDNSEFAPSAPAGSQEAINAVFRKKQNDIKQCYQRVTNAQGKVTGSFVVKIAIGKDGVVMSIEKLEDQIGGEMFSCVRQRVMNWKFGPQKAPIVFKKKWVFS